MSILVDGPSTRSVPDDDRRLTLDELLALGGCHRAPADVHKSDPVAANDSGSDNQNSTTVAANRGEPMQGVSPNLAKGCHRTSDRRSGHVSSLLASLEHATQANYRNKAKTKTLRSALTLPPKPSESSYLAHKVRSNKKAISLEHRVLQFERQMAERLAKRKTNPRMRYAPHDSAYERLWTYGSALAYRALNDRHKAGESIPDTADLQAAIALHLERRAKRFLRPSDPMPARGYLRFATVDSEQLNYLSLALAGAVLRDWRQTWIEKKQEAGRTGGLTSKPPAGLWADAEKLAELAEHMDRETNAQLCRRFENISPSTLHRGLRALGGRST